MIEIIKNKLNAEQKITSWVIKKITKTSKELFFIKTKLDMNREVIFTEYQVKIYVDFSQNGVEYTGDVLFTIGQSDSEKEIQDKIDFAVKQAQFVKNKPYKLFDNHTEKLLEIKSQSNIKKFMDKFKDLSDLINHDYKKDGIHSNINSFELFVIDINHKIQNSYGLNLSYDTSKVSFELVTDNDTGKESVEIFTLYDIRDFDIEKIRKIFVEQLTQTDLRAKAVTSPKLENVKVILSNDAVQELLQYYLDKATDQYIFSKLSNYKVGKKIQKETAKNKITLKTIPNLENVVNPQIVDGDGVILKEQIIINNGEVNSIMSGSKIGSYLNMPISGYTANFAVNAGEISEKELRSGDYLEIKMFSSFLTDNATGDFGGEFRLAILHKDAKELPVSGGSLSLNLNDVQDKMIFSKELEQRSYSLAPSVIAFENVSVAGE
ncbi:metallopeptidase TldD-related protein [Criibacterium bergeronii]|uniref:Peptidase n=1 Tax=Criibacterium bergeronii TaxID=1871336 RepID=A0A371INP8_9FIRM|nr:metallopeptidase TldD-related protein [Criibacterium bergeronii]RDY22121.1 peptidase [Criibacterium bergeronii]TRW27778.1 peptidase [Criibacterium bergeronii]